MNKVLKAALKESFEAPVPERKSTFLRDIQTPPIRGFEFVCTQAAYIRKWIWALSALAFAAALIGAELLEKNMLWRISAFMPLLALSVITESGRSKVYGMVEFECSTRFSLRSVILARLGILGAADSILICLLIPFALKNSGVSLLQTGVYMLCPYLLTAFLGLWVIRKVPGREAVYLCIGIAMGISFGNIFFYLSFSMFYAEHSLIWWLAALVVLSAGTVNQCRQMIKQTEELAWNL